MEKPEQELCQILSTSTSQIGDSFPRLRSLDSIVLYGAGNLGIHTLRKLHRMGLRPLAFADDTPEKQGMLVEGVPVMSPASAAERFGEQLVFVVTIMNAKLRFLDAKHRLEALTNTPVFSFLHLAHQFPDVFLPYYQFESPSQLQSKAKDILVGFQLWSDDESRRQFVAHIKLRLFLDYAALPGNREQGYLPRDVFSNMPAETVFVDCGAYDGDTIRQFLQQQDGRFGRIYAFEPDEKNCQRLREYVQSMGDNVASRVQIFNAAVGNARKEIGFNVTGDMSASFTESGSTRVQVLPLDEVVPTDGAPAFLKFDVEGAEAEALQGARNLIRESRPIVAVSIYHRPDDLWQLPMQLNSLTDGYRFFLRTQGEDGMDVICYAVPYNPQALLQG